MLKLSRVLSKSVWMNLTLHIHTEASELLRHTARRGQMFVSRFQFLGDWGNSQTHGTPKHFHKKVLQPEKHNFEHLKHQDPTKQIQRSFHIFNMYSTFSLRHDHVL